MDWSILGIFTYSLGVGYSGAMAPGPLLTIAVSESARRGFWVGPLLVLGHAVAELLLIAALALGLTRLLAFGEVKAAIALVGGLVLVWMGYGIVRAIWKGSISLKAAMAKEARTTNHHVMTGAVVSVSNPYWIIWWATGGAALLSKALDAGAPGIISFYTGHILSDLTWYSLVAAIVAGGGRFFDDRVYRAVLSVCALVLIALGAWFVVSGVQFWLG